MNKPVTKLTESHIVHENGSYWVAAEGTAYTVYRVAGSVSVSDSSYSPNEDGLSLAKYRCNYLAKRESKGESSQ